jgi:hypothetical protein
LLQAVRLCLQQRRRIKGSPYENGKLKLAKLCSC